MINIRKIEMSDADEFVVLQKGLAEETKFMMREPEECTMDAVGAEERIKGVHQRGDFLFVAEVDGELIGFLSAAKGGLNRIKHRAYIVIGIRKAYQGQGIGHGLFQELDHWATAQKLRRLELTVMVVNIGAKKLYEKNGFVVEGIKKDAMRVDGQYVDEYYMGKVLE